MYKMGGRKKWCRIRERISLYKFAYSYLFNFRTYTRSKRDKRSMRGFAARKTRRFLSTSEIFASVCHYTNEYSRAHHSSERLCGTRQFALKRLCDGHGRALGGMRRLTDVSSRRPQSSTDAIEILAYHRATVAVILERP